MTDIRSQQIRELLSEARQATDRRTSGLLDRSDFQEIIAKLAAMLQQMASDATDFDVPSVNVPSMQIVALPKPTLSARSDEVVWAS